MVESNCHSISQQNITTIVYVCFRCDDIQPTCCDLTTQNGGGKVRGGEVYEDAGQPEGHARVHTGTRRLHIENNFFLVDNTCTKKCCRHWYCKSRTAAASVNILRPDRYAVCRIRIIVPNTVRNF